MVFCCCCILQTMVLSWGMFSISTVPIARPHQPPQPCWLIKERKIHLEVKQNLIRNMNRLNTTNLLLLFWNYSTLHGPTPSDRQWMEWNERPTNIILFAYAVLRSVPFCSVVCGVVFCLFALRKFSSFVMSSGLPRKSFNTSLEYNLELSFSIILMNIHFWLFQLKIMRISRGLLCPSDGLFFINENEIRVITRWP